MMKKLLYLILLVFFWPLSAQATPQFGVLKTEPSQTLPADTDNDWNVIPENAKRLSAQQLELAFFGITHRGQYRFRREAVNTFAFTETTHKDGTLIHRQGRETLSGIWEIRGDQICYTYQKIWTYPVCFNIYKSGTCYYHLLRSSNGRPTYAVTARSTPATQEPDCDAFIS